MFGKLKKGKGGGGHGGGHDDLMITPLLDLFVALIPFLIMSVVLTKINVVGVAISKPSQSSGVTKPDFDLHLKVSEKEAQLFLKGALQLKAPRSEDWVQKVRVRLVEIKKQYPNEMKIRVEPQGEASLELLMGFMDGARELRKEDGDILRKDEKGNAVKARYLFPTVVLKGVYKS